ncbi:hypothetical protein KIN20_018116 [Parelaphostrongylus tenuis]|uniref:Uncharacterized protein n=1 Tax=Parelaphostrongylus tenuis TaxID=148309 RepID=A0AAD5MIU0_PARTN|nr:hypothetical protein KIN20_018116 [Parelaphostrongylus tenuis]
MAWIDPLDAGRFQKFPFFLLVNLGPLRPCRASRAKLNFVHCDILGRFTPNVNRVRFPYGVD